MPKLASINHKPGIEDDADREGLPELGRRVAWPDRGRGRVP